MLNHLLASEALELNAELKKHADEIHTRLAEFRAVPSTRYFYELSYCIMTPQSSAAQCGKVAAELERRGFLANVFNPESLLRSFEGGYVRFHRTKAQHLLALRNTFPTVLPALLGEDNSKVVRDILVKRISGLGMKEASHFLRNIGRTNLAIIDRHIIRNLIRFGLLPEWPKSISRKQYLALEETFENLANTLHIAMDELDLLLWRRETGVILK